MADPGPRYTVQQIEQWKKFAYSPKGPELEEGTIQVLENYSKIPRDKIVEHVTNIREKGFSIQPYPCIGQWRFLHLAIGRHDLYSEIVQRMRTSNEILLDAGCAFAQDIRRLVADGVDSSKCYGFDLRLEFLDLGYELFKDKDILKTRFIEANVFEEENDLTQLYGKVDIINASSFFHLFGWDECKQIAERCVKLFSGKKNNLLVGRQVGNEEAGEFDRPDGSGKRYRHNVDSWTRLWTEVGKKHGIEFEVKAKLSDEIGFMPSEPNAAKEQHPRMMMFSVRRIN